MSLFGTNPNEVNYVGGEKHFVDIIKNRSDNDTFIFKNPEEDFNHGSTLVVQPGEQAVFVNEGNIEQVFESGTYTLSTANYPFISRLRNALSGAISSFHCIVYFVRTATGREIKWGTADPIKVYDKAYLDPFTGIGVETEVGANGAYKVSVTDAGLLLTNLIGGNYDLIDQESIREFFRNQFMNELSSKLAEELNAWDGPLNTIQSQGSNLAHKMETLLSPYMEEYGLRPHDMSLKIHIFDNEERKKAQELVSKNRETYYSNMAAGAGKAAFAQGQQQAYQTYGTNYQQAEVLKALNNVASNPGSEGSSLMGAGMGLTMGAGLGQVLPGMLNQTLNAANQQNPVATPNIQTSTAPQQSETTQQQPSSVAPAAQTTADNDPVARLKKLKSLLDADLISKEEYEAKKANILKEL